MTARMVPTGKCGGAASRSTRRASRSRRSDPTSRMAATTKLAIGVGRPRGASQANDEGGDEGREGAERVAQQVQPRAAQVQGVPVALPAFSGRGAWPSGRGPRAPPGRDRPGCPDRAAWGCPCPRASCSSHALRPLTTKASAVTATTIMTPARGGVRSRKRLDPLDDDARRRGQDQQRAEDRRDGLGAPQAVRGARPSAGGRPGASRGGSRPARATSMSRCARPPGARRSRPTSAPPSSSTKNAPTSARTIFRRRACFASRGVKPAGRPRPPLPSCGWRGVVCLAASTRFVGRGLTAEHVVVGDRGRGRPTAPGRSRRRAARPSCRGHAGWPGDPARATGTPRAAGTA